MKYLFDMGEVWHVYADMGNQWIYYRLEQVSEESIEKNGAELPGPLGRLDLLKQLEEQNQIYKEQKEAYEKQYYEMQKTLEESQIQMQQEREHLELQKKKEIEHMKQQFETSYVELKELAEKMQEEGRVWRQRYLDLAYQVSPKGKT